MSDQSDAVLACRSEHRQQLRLSEDQRAVLTNYILVISSALAGFAVQQKLARETPPLCMLIVVMGVPCMATGAEYHERVTYHLAQARALAKALTDLGALPEDETLLDEYRQRHYRKLPRFHRIRLHVLWMGLHCAIALLSLTLGVIVQVKQ